MHSGLGDALIEVATDRVEVRVDVAAGHQLQTVAEDLAAAGMCLVVRDAATGRALVRIPAGMSLDEAMSQIATVPGVTGMRLDPVVRGTGGDDDGDDGGGSGGADDGQGG